jgi:nicotinamidase-related amidase
MKTLLIVDMVNDFVHPDGSAYLKSGKKIIPLIERKLSEARKAGHLIIFLRDSHRDDPSEFKIFPKHCITGSWGSEIIEELTPIDGEIVVLKNKFSGFFGTNLGHILYQFSVSEADVVGVCTSICVMDTVQGLSYRNIKISVYKDMVADATRKDHRQALKRMRLLYGADIR